MKENIREYARAGLVHHMLYPKSMEDFDEHMATLAAFVRRGDIETFDCCLPYGEQQRAKLTSIIRNCDKSDIGFAVYLFPFHKFSFCTPEPNERAQVRLIVKDMVEQAVAIGAAGFIFGSGGPSPAQATDAHRIAFAEFCRWLCGELKPYGITAMLEPFDMTIDKKFLYGPTKECVALVESLKPEVDNFGIELDVAHLPLMGERFEDAIQTVAPCLRRVHLGNCILKDKSHPLYGDRHVPIGFDGGEIDIPEVTNILRYLLEVGFLNKKNRGSLLIEMTRWPGRTEEETIKDNLSRLEQAWDEV